MGSVSHKLLVLVTRMPRASISRHARSISAIRSPRLLPRAMYAVLARLRLSVAISLAFPMWIDLGKVYRVKALGFGERRCGRDEKAFRQETTASPERRAWIDGGRAAAL